MGDYRFRLGMSSVDRAGVIFYPELFRHAHDAYELFMAGLGEDLSRLLDARDYLLPIVHAAADYVRPIYHGEETKVRITVAKIGDSSFTLEYGFLDRKGVSLARVTTVHVCIDGKTGGSQPLSARLREELRAYLSAEA
ncbi:MAG: acyl-CoA thioesterase [Gammaproteobacteria bacterium]|nr:acyl-CoA thioesterase [Gammaproteobacteria bacterium]